MPIRPIEVSTFSKIPSFVPFGVEYFTQDTADLYVGTGASSGPAVTAVNGGGGGIGTVTSVSFTGDGTVLSATPSAVVTTAGTLQAALANANANTVLGNATSTVGAPAYGQIVNGQIANATIDLTTKVTGVLPVTNGGVAVISTIGGIILGLDNWPNNGLNINQVVTSGNANETTLWAFVQKHTQVVGHISTRNNTSLGAGTHWGAGAYDSAGNLAFQTGALDGTFTSGQTVTAKDSSSSPISYTMKPGLYYLAVTSSTAGAGNTLVISIASSIAIYTQFANTGTGTRIFKSATASSGGVLPGTMGTLSAQAATVQPVALFVEP